MVMSRNKIWENASSKELEKKVVVSISVTPVVSRLGPTITGRVTGSFRNLHGGATECQGGCKLSRGKTRCRNSIAAGSARHRRRAARRKRPPSVSPQTECSGRADQARATRCGGSASDVRAHRCAPRCCRNIWSDRHRRPLRRSDMRSLQKPRWCSGGLPGRW